MLSGDGGRGVVLRCARQKPCAQTTFMNLMSGDLIPNLGQSRRSHKLRIGRYAQVCVCVGGLAGGSVAGAQGRQGIGSASQRRRQSLAQGGRKQPKLAAAPAGFLAARVPSGAGGPWQRRRGEAWRRSCCAGVTTQHFVDALAFDENPVEYLLNKFPEAGLKPEVCGLSTDCSRRERTRVALFVVALARPAPLRRRSRGAVRSSGPPTARFAARATCSQGMRAMLGRFGLSGQHHLTPICKLSGGQKARVVFTAISLSNPHILLLDEPTNHLDMQSIDALCDALEEFEGGIVVISHDAQLLSRLCEDEERSQVSRGRTVGGCEGRASSRIRPRACSEDVSRVLRRVRGGAGACGGGRHDPQVQRRL